MGRGERGEWGGRGEGERRGRGGQVNAKGIQPNEPEPTSYDLMTNIM